MDVAPSDNCPQSQSEAYDLQAALGAHMTRLLEPWESELTGCGISSVELMAKCLDLCRMDLRAFVNKDPASKRSWSYVLESYSCLHAIIAYRLAHQLLELRGADPWRLAILARRISERAKVLTGVEIHPSASIGTALVIDHGMGTVIGEDVVIGSDCYLLQGVVLGAMGIASNPGGRRHPWLGDRVQVGSFARVLGPISIGDDVVIGSYALIRDDVASGCQVALLHQSQVISGRQPLAIYGVETLGLFRFRLHGADLNHPCIEIDLLDVEQELVERGAYTVMQTDNMALTVELSPTLHRGPAVTHIRVRKGSSSVTVAVPLSRTRLARPQVPGTEPFARA